MSKRLPISGQIFNWFPDVSAEIVSFLFDNILFGLFLSSFVEDSFYFVFLIKCYLDSSFLYFN